MPSSVRRAVPQDLVNAVKVMEGFEETPYPDSGRLSIGYGTKAKPGEVVTKGEAEVRLTQELSVHAGIVDRAASSVGLKLTPGQRNALISFDFNTGSAKELITSSKGNIEEIAWPAADLEQARKGRATLTRTDQPAQRGNEDVHVMIDDLTASQYYTDLDTAEGEDEESASYRAARVRRVPR